MGLIRGKIYLFATFLAFRVRINQFQGKSVQILVFCVLVTSIGIDYAKKISHRGISIFAYSGYGAPRPSVFLPTYMILYSVLSRTYHFLSTWRMAMNHDAVADTARAESVSRDVVQERPTQSTWGEGVELDPPPPRKVPNSGGGPVTGSGGSVAVLGP